MSNDEFYSIESDTEQLDLDDIFQLEQNSGVPHFLYRRRNKALDILLKIIGYRRWVKGYLGYIFTCIYGLFLLFPAVMSAITFILTFDELSVSYMLFNSIMPIQYILGVIYMNQRHFENILSDCNKSDIGIPTNFKMFLLIIVVSAVSTIGLTLIWALSNTIPTSYKYILSSISTDNGIIIDTAEERVIVSLMIINWLMSSLAISTNIIIFWIVFRKHIEDTELLYSNIQKNSWGMNQIAMNEITQDIVSIRTVIVGSVDKLGSFYTSMTILGALAIGPILDFKVIDPFLIFYVTVYTFCYIIFTYFMVSLDKKRGDILKEVMSPIMMYKFLTNLKGVKDYRVLKTDFEKLQKSVPDRFQTLNKWKMAAYDFNHIEEEKRDGLLTEESARINELLTQQYKSIAILSWNILKDELKEEWTTFDLFGFEFNGREAIKKGVGITGIIVVISTTISTFTLR